MYMQELSSPMLRIEDLKSIHDLEDSFPTKVYD